MLTSEQNEAVNHVIETLERSNIQSQDYTSIKAIAGSGKSATLKAIADKYAKTFQLKPEGDLLYMVFNKSMAKEAEEKNFPTNTKITTIHSLAYQNIVRPFGMRVGFIKAAQIKHKIMYQNKMLVLNTLESFYISASTSYDEFILSKIEPGNILRTKKYIDIAKEIMRQMRDGKLPSTHGFYLKLLHLMLVSNSNSLPISANWPTLIMFDEAQDAAPVALEIFKLINARHKVFVGDNLQNIYSFMDTVSIFDEISHAKEFTLTKSFRVSNKLARKIESFCKEHISSDIKFSGIEIIDNSIDSVAYIFRNNIGILNKAIDLDQAGKPFKLIRDVSAMFDMPIAIQMASKKENHGLVNKNFKEFIVDYHEWIVHSEVEEAKSFLSYVMSKHKGNDDVKSSCRLLVKHGIKKIMQLKLSLENSKQNSDARITLCTAHSSKGLEFDKVYISSGLNDSVGEILDTGIRFKDLNKEQKSEIYLYYVAVTRARKELDNAIHLIGAESC